MKVQAILIGLLALSGIALFFTENQKLESNESVTQMYEQWRIQHGKQHSTYRLQNFIKNLEIIRENNANPESTVILGLTQFADLTNAEYREQMLSKILERNQGEVVDIKTNPNAGSINWIEKGAVTSVKDQGRCGSCWAFSTVAGLEGAYAISEGNLVNLSEQQVTSCVPAPFSLGCNGGNPLFGYTYTSIKGIETDAAYPYVQKDSGKTAPCEYDSSKVVFTNKGVGQVPANSPDQMLSQLQTQPLSVAVDAANITFQLYNGGVITKNCGTNLDHAITLVGYDANENYWIVKNSWGASWGDKGYVNIQKTSGDGLCGINMDVSFPTW